MRGLTLVEIVVMVVIVALLAALILPVLAIRKRECGPVPQCVSNIRSILIAMNYYAEAPSNGGFMPTLSKSRDDPFAQTESSSEALNLLYRQYVSDPRIFACPQDPNKPSPAKLQQIQAWPTSGSKAFKRMTPAHTSYAYDPGHRANVNSLVALIAEALGVNGQSNNHSKEAGQYVGFGTSVEFRTSAKNPLGEGAMDNSIFTLGDTVPGASGSVTRDEDSFIRR